MVKKYKIMGIDCANCARELEDQLNKLPGIHSLKISFLMQKMTVDFQDELQNQVKDLLQKEASHFEKGITIFDA